MMRLVLVMLFFGLLFAGPASGQNVGGNYAVSGTNPNGSTYSGAAEIASTPKACRITWRIGSSTSEGFCMATAKAVAAFYRLGNSFGLVVYDVQPNGVLAGYWRVLDQEGIGGEILTPRTH